MTKTLLTWLHLSDVHFGDGSYKHEYDKSLVLTRLIEDCTALSTDGIKPDLVLVSGDVAFSAATKSSDEYIKASQWLDQLIADIGVAPENVHIIPGNHDADLTRDATKELKYLLGQLRSGKENIDNVLPDSHAPLSERFAAFRSFASRYGTGRIDLGGNDHWWIALDLPSLAGVPVAIAGLNTALTTLLQSNEKSLQLGLKPLAAIDELAGSKTILIAMTHHPLNEAWMQDYSTIKTRFAQRVDVHLCGHLHGADIQTQRRGGQKQMLTVVSGAVHGEEGEEVGYGYSLGALIADGNEAIVRIWPRLFYPGKQDFDRHVELLPRDTAFSEYPLGGKAQAIISKARISSVPPIPTEASSLQSGVDDLLGLVSAIEVDGLKRFASKALGDLRISIKKIALLKQTPELTAGAYYAFLNPLIEKRPSGSTIWAISTIMPVEWTDDPYESRFLSANLEAANRGVKIKRVFVVPEKIIDTIHAIEPIMAQVRHSGIETFLVTREHLESNDPKLLARIGAGIIAFDDELVLVDRHNSDGSARGHGTYSAEDIVSWRETFSELLTHARVFSS